jgi:hypothetical protein
MSAGLGLSYMEREFLFGEFLKIFLLDVFPRPSFQAGAEDKRKSELAGNRGLD